MFVKTSRLIQSFLDDGIFPGVEYLIYQRGTYLYEIKGRAQIVPTVETLDTGMLFDVASLTKVIGTTSLLLKWWESGLIHWEDPLKKYLPRFQDERVTLLQLLTHTSDLDSYIPNRNQLSESQLRQAFMQLKSGQERGKKMVYTDTGTILLGFMIEELTGVAVQTYLEKEVLEPLGMTGATFFPKNRALCVPTEETADRGVIRGEVHDPKAHILGAHCGSAGLFASLTALMKFAEMLLNSGVAASGQAFLKEATVLSLLKDWTFEAGLSRSLGWDLKYNLQDGKPILFHTGYTGTFLMIDVLRQSYFIFLSNRVHPVDNRLTYLEKRDTLIQQYLEEKKEREH